MSQQRTPLSRRNARPGARRPAAGAALPAHPRVPVPGRRVEPGGPGTWPSTGTPAWRPPGCGKSPPTPPTTCRNRRAGGGSPGRLGSGRRGRPLQRRHVATALAGGAPTWCRPRSARGRTGRAPAAGASLRLLRPRPSARCLWRRRTDAHAPQGDRATAAGPVASGRDDRDVRRSRTAPLSGARAGTRPTAPSAACRERRPPSLPGWASLPPTRAGIRVGAPARNRAAAAEAAGRRTPAAGSKRRGRPERAASASPPGTRTSRPSAQT
ncbi:hypothetical protein STENM327S_02001 [Streptomyces tendae]